jgi:acyl-CoA reductase-like NAD-dependent aldehyde dehydrogenase
MSFEAHMTIGGKPVGSDNWSEVYNPAHLTELVGRYPNGSAGHAAAAVFAATEASPQWRATPADERAALLLQAVSVIEQRHREWAPLLTAENGKPLVDSTMDFQMAMGGIAAYAAQSGLMADEVRLDKGRKLIVRKQPLGVCVSIIPWNYPLTIAAASVPPALLAGNTVVVKVPEFAPLATLECLGAVASVLPPGVLNVVSGFGPDIGAALVKDARVRKVSFTGSTAIGKVVMADAASHLARVTLELGGNDAALILHDADISADMVDRVVTGTFTDAGQICFAIKRLYVHESRYDELVDGVRERVKQIVVGDGMRPDVTMGPLTNERQFNKVRDLLAETTAAYDAVELGSYAEHTRVKDGYFLLPHLVLNPPDEATIVTCEQMGPILPIMKFSNEDEAVARANATEYGLASSVWSTDIDRAFALGDRLEAGTTFVNGHSLFTVDPDAPFGGFKESGIGYNGGGQVALSQYVQLKAVTTHHL